MKVYIVFTKPHNINRVFKSKTDAEKYYKESLGHLYLCTDIEAYEVEPNSELLALNEK